MIITTARGLGAGFVMGTDVVTAGGVAHASILFPPDNGLPRHYDKQQLVPFGEFIPFRSLWPAALRNSFGFFKTDVTPGENATLLAFDAGNNLSVAVGPFICYESMYPQYARAMTRAGANLLVTQSNDSWFQSRAAQEQHLAAALCRAVENRRAVVRATTNGITALIDANGQVIAQAPRNAAAFVSGEVTLSSGRSLYARLRRLVRRPMRGADRAGAGGQTGGSGEKAEAGQGAGVMPAFPFVFYPQGANYHVIRIESATHFYRRGVFGD